MQNAGSIGNRYLIENGTVQEQESDVPLVVGFGLPPFHAFPTTSDVVRDEARQEGAGGDSSCAHMEPRRQEEGTWPDLSMTASVVFLWSVL